MTRSICYVFTTKDQDIEDPKKYVKRNVEEF